MKVKANVEGILGLFRNRADCVKLDVWRAVEHVSTDWVSWKGTYCTLRYSNESSLVPYSSTHMMQNTSSKPSPAAKYSSS